MGKHTAYKNLTALGNLFYIILFIKIIIGTLIAPLETIEKFIPFIENLSLSFFSDNHEYLFKESKEGYYSYPVLLLYILHLPFFLIGWVSNNIFYKLFLLRLPLIICDVLIFLVLKTFLKETSYKRLIVLYWLSPVLIYINYFNEQFDIVSIAFIFLSLYFLFKESLWKTIIFLSAAISSKITVIILFPFYFLYLYSKEVSLFRLFFFFVVFILIFLLFNSPHIFDLLLLKTILFEQEQIEFFSSFVSLNNSSFFLMPSALLILFVKGCFIKIYNKDIFMMFLGFAISIVLFFSPPIKGSYFWLIPFLSFFYSKENQPVFLLYLLQIFYLLYFFLAKESYFLTFLGYPFKLLYDFYLSRINIDVILTLLQTTLFINCFFIYKKGLESYRKNKITAKPFLIGIGGSSGVGKTTISNAILQIFTSQNTTILCGDDMHKWQRGHKKWDELTHFDPKANHLHKEIAFLKKLKKGHKIFRSHYDHNIGKFTSEEILHSKNIIVFEGLHPFYLKAQQSLYDLKIFVKPYIDLVYHWKLIRDQKERGHSKEKIISSIEKCKNDYKKHIEEQIKKADILVEIFPYKKIKNIGDYKENVKFFYIITMPNDIYIEPLIEDLNRYKNLKVNQQYIKNDKQKIILKGNCSDDKINKIANEYIDTIKDLGVNQINIPKGIFGVLMLILIFCIFEKDNVVNE